jgi:hypothetical protein
MVFFTWSGNLHMVKIPKYLTRHNGNKLTLIMEEFLLPELFGWK